MNTLPFCRAVTALRPKILGILIPWIFGLCLGEVILGPSCLAGPENPTAAQIINQLKPGHPRVLLTPEILKRLRDGKTTDPAIKRYYESLRKETDELLKDAPSEPKVRANYSSMRSRVPALAIRYLLDGDRRFLNQAWAWMEAGADSPNWTKPEWLRAAGLAEGIALGYDWLYHDLTAVQRAKLRNALLTKAINPALEVYADGSQFWPTAKMNWNWVCNGCVGMASLAIGDEAPGPCGDFIRQSIASVKLPMEAMQPDGAWEEGCDYWATGLIRLMKYVAALDSACGSTFGLLDDPGLQQTGWFPLYALSPLKRTYNFADAYPTARPLVSPFMFTLARLQNEPLFAWYESFTTNQESLEKAIWYQDSNGVTPKTRNLPLGKYFGGANEFITYRTEWENPDAFFVGFKGGHGGASHRHVDAGSFIFEALGVRWAVDLGKIPGYAKGYFSRVKTERFNYYVQRAEGHNTLLFQPGADPGQDFSAPTHIVEHRIPSASENKDFYAIVDLSPAYHEYALSVKRGLRLVDRKCLLVQDEVSAAKSGSLYWFLHFDKACDVESLSKNTVLLSQNGKRCLVRVLEPVAAGIEIVKAESFPSSPKPPIAEKNKTGSRKLSIRLDAFTGGRISVIMVPLKAGEDIPSTFPSLQPLSMWKQE